MKVLITGGAGFIGSNLTVALHARGHDVTVLDSLCTQIHGQDPENKSPLYRSIAGRARFVRGSVCDRNDWLQALAGQEAIIHLAAETGTGQSMYEIDRYSDVNVGGTAVMLDLLANRKHTVKKVLVASSRAIYGEGRYRSRALGVVYPDARRESDLRSGRFEPLCPQTGAPLELLSTDENSKLHPTSVYGITKHTQEMLVLTVCRSLDLAATALRYQNVFGPGQSLGNPYTGILSIFSTRILNGNSLNIFEDGNESRDFVFIDDVVTATLSALSRDDADGEAINVGSGVPTSVMTVAETLVKHYASDVPIRVTGAYRLGDIRHNYADLIKATRLLDFTPQVDFQTGMSRFTRWVKEQVIETDVYDTSLDEMRARGLFRD